MGILPISKIAVGIPWKGMPEAWNSDTTDYSFSLHQGWEAPDSGLRRLFHSEGVAASMETSSFPTLSVTLMLEHSESLSRTVLVTATVSHKSCSSTHDWLVAWSPALLCPLCSQLLPHALAHPCSRVDEHTDPLPSPGLYTFASLCLACSSPTCRPDLFPLLLQALALMPSSQRAFLTTLFNTGTPFLNPTTFWPVFFLSTAFSTIRHSIYSHHLFVLSVCSRWRDSSINTGTFAYFVQCYSPIAGMVPSTQ